MRRLRAGYRILPPFGIAMAAVVGIATSAPAQHFPDDEDLALMLRYIVEDSVAPGMILGVLEADGSRRVLAFGSGGPEAGPLTPESTFETGSVSKVFAGTLLADMVQRGEVALDDPVANYLPGSVRVPSMDGREITLQDLATHRSGLPRDHPITDPTDPFADLTTDRLYEIVSRAELRRPPGSSYNYSNIGIGLLANALGRAARTSYATLVRERILAPLGMSRSSFGLEGDIGESMIQGHERNGPQRLYTRPEPVHGPGGLRSNVPDLLTFLEAQIGDPESELEESMRLAHQARAATGDGRIGLAWMTNVIGGRPIVWHAGTSGGFTTLVAFDPERELGVVTMANVEPQGVGLGLTLLSQRLRAPAEWLPATVDTALLRRYAGVYEAGSELPRYYVRLEQDGSLTYQPAGLARARLYPTSDSTFYLLRGAFSFTFRRNAATGEMSVEMVPDERDDDPGRTIIAQKVSDEIPTPIAAAGGGWYRPERESGFGIWGFLGLAALTALVLLVSRLRPWRRRSDDLEWG